MAKIKDSSYKCSFTNSKRTGRTVVEWPRASDDWRHAPRGLCGIRSPPIQLVKEISNKKGVHMRSAIVLSIIQYKITYSVQRSYGDDSIRARINAIKSALNCFVSLIKK